MDKLGEYPFDGIADVWPEMPSELVYFTELCSRQRTPSMNTRRGRLGKKHSSFGPCYVRDSACGKRVRRRENSAGQVPTESSTTYRLL